MCLIRYISSSLKLGKTCILVTQCLLLSLFSVEVGFVLMIYMKISTFYALLGVCVCVMSEVCVSEGESV